MCSCVILNVFSRGSPTFYGALAGTSQGDVGVLPVCLAGWMAGWLAACFFERCPEDLVFFGKLGCMGDHFVRVFSRKLHLCNM